MLNELINNCCPQTCFGLTKQIIVTANIYRDNIPILRSTKIAVFSALIMKYLENKWIFLALVDFIYLPLNNSFMIFTNQGMNQEYIEHWEHFFKYIFFNLTVSISHWHKHWLVRVIVKLYLYAAKVHQGLRMSLECAIEHIIYERGASLGGLIRVCRHLKGEYRHVLLETVEELLVDIREEIQLHLIERCLDCCNLCVILLYRLIAY